MGEVLGCINKEENNKLDKENELELRHSIVLRQDDSIKNDLRQTIKDDPLMENDLYNRLTIFNQKHVMENFKFLTRIEKRILIQDCKTIDFIKLDFIFHQILQKGYVISDKFKTLEYDEIFKKKIKIEKDKKLAEKKIDIGNRLLAQGRCCLFIILEENNTNFESQFTTLKIFIEKIKKKCENLKITQKYFYENRKKKENFPIKIFLVSPSKNLVQVKSYLENNSYFSYNPILVVGQNDLPVITKKEGKMLLDSKIRIKKKSLGTGGIFNIMRSYEILDLEILYNVLHYIQLIKLDNINCEILDPFCLGEIHENNDCIINRMSFDKNLKENFNYKFEDGKGSKYDGDKNGVLLLDSYVHYSYFFKIDKFFKKYNFVENIRIKEYDDLEYLETKATEKGQTVCSFYYDFFDLLHFGKKNLFMEYEENEVKFVNGKENEKYFKDYEFNLKTVNDL